MRKMVLSLIPLAALALAGCNSSSSPQSTDGSPAPSGSAAAAKIANEVSGTVNLHTEAGQTLSPKAVLAINLVDVSSTAEAGAAPLASKTVPGNQFPQSFALSFDATKVKADDLYVVRAVVTDGERHYTMNIQAPVLTKGNKNDGIAIDLVAQQTAGEKVLAEFTAEQKQLGAMKVKSGTKLDKDVSRSWQVFRQNNDLKFIRELVDYGAKGFTTTDYAYKNGKPWVVVQQTKPNQGAKPTAIDRAGWDDNGNLVLKQHEVNGDVQVLDDAVASSLQKQGADILTLATGGKGK